MKTLLLRPNSKKKNYQELEKDLAAIAPPIWMAARATELLKQKISIEVVDAEIQKLDMNTTAGRIEIFPSGNHSSAYIQQKEGIDFLAEEFKKMGKEVKVWDCLPDFNFNDSPNWDLFPMDKYKCHTWHAWQEEERVPYGIVCSSYGCPYKCDFCIVNYFYKTGYKERPLELVVNEIKELVKKHSIKNLKFVDEMFLFKPKRIEKLCDMLIAEGLDLNIWAYAKISIIPVSLLPKLRKAGFKWLGIGIESGNEEIRRKILKGTYTNKQIKDTMAVIRDNNIYVSAAYIFGFIEDTYETMYQTLIFAKELNCEQANFHSKMCYPNSPEYNKIKKLGWYLPETWSEYSQYSYKCHPIRTKYLTSAEVLKFRDNAFHDYYTDPIYLDMIKTKFGEKTIKDIRKMTNIRLKRSLY